MRYYRFLRFLARELLTLIHNLRYKFQLTNRLGYYPNGLQLNLPQHFSVHETARVGHYNKIQFSRFGIPFETVNPIIELGRHAWTGENVELHVWGNNQIKIKDYSSIQDNCKLLGDITIEKYCLIAPSVFISSGNHYFSKLPYALIKDQDAYVLSTHEGVLNHSQKIHIEEDCWIGYGVFIKRGCYIGKGAIIGANTVVTHDVFPYSIQGGVPNKELNKRLIFSPPKEIFAHKTDNLPYFYRGFAQKKFELDESLKSGVIWAENQSVVILEGINFSSLNIVGRVNVDNSACSITVEVNNRHLYTGLIGGANKEFNITIPFPTDVTENYTQTKTITNTLPNILQKYTYIVFSITQTQEKTDSRYPLGISHITLN